MGSSRARWESQWSAVDTGGSGAADRMPAADPPLLDADAIERLRELDPSGQQGVVERVLKAYRSSLDRHLADIAAALPAHDTDRLVRAAHTLKSSSAAVGAMSFSQRCADVELSVRTDKSMPPSQQVEALIHEGHQVLAAVGAMLAP
jgi:histidine phosphotransfer protein HptB